MEFDISSILISFITLSFLEIVLGIDNLIFIALVVGNLPAHMRKKARLFGLTLALVIRIVMLMSISWVMTLTEPLFTIKDAAVSFKDLLLLAGGIFLIAKSTFEMHADLAGIDERKEIMSRSTYIGAIIQITIIDFVFSFDSILTAVGLSNQLGIMIAAIVVAMIVMLVASNHITEFLRKYPTFKMLALSFILMIGMMLIAEAFHFHMPREYIYFAFGFSMFVEAMNTVASNKRRKMMAQREENESESST